LRRRYGHDSINYFAVVEETKQGEPHLHILLRSPYIPQAFISDCMRDLIGAPIVDIRRIRSARDVVTYVAKYITKAPKQFGTAKRYWSSRDYEIKERDDYSGPPPGAPRWQVDRRPLHEILEAWIMDGYMSRRGKADVIIGLPIPGYYLDNRGFSP